MPSMSLVERSFCRSAPWRGFARRTVLPWALQGLEPRGTMLELGAGSGAMAEGAARTFPGVRLTVTDLDPVMVEAARERLARLDNVQVRRADITDLPFDDASYDVVASYLMLHHVIDWPAALREVARVLRPGGTFVGYDLDKTLLAELVHVVDRSPHRLVAREELRAGLVAAGFVDVEVTPAVASQVVKFRARAG